MSPTFRQLCPHQDVQSESASSLELWYERIQDTPIDVLPIGDLCRACRQDLFPAQVLPVAIARLMEDPTAGNLYDGELAVAVSGAAHGACRTGAIAPDLCIKALEFAVPTLDAEQRAEVESVLAGLKAMQG